MISIARPYIGPEEKQAVLEVLESGMLAQGPKVAELEEKFAEYCGVKHAVAVNSGTAAMHAALYAVGVQPGDEVITVPFTFVATVNPILMQGARPVFVDIQEDTFNIDPFQVKKAIASKTTAIVPVDLFGHPFDVEALETVAQQHNLKIVEDACQAVGAACQNRKAGSLGHVAGFSFYATKNMMTGEGGILTTNDSEVAEQARRFRHHGQSQQTRYQYHDLGYNYRMMDLQAAIGLVQLKRIEGWNQERQQNAARLTEGLQGIPGLITPQVQPGMIHVFHQYTIRVTKDFSDSRDGLMERLKNADIGSAVFYPKPLHLHPHFARLGYRKGDFPVAERLAGEVLSLPVHPGVTEHDIDKIIETIHEKKVTIKSLRLVSEKIQEN